MANPYYNHGSIPAQGSFGASSPMRGEFDLVTAGFALLPALTPNTAIVVNAGGTALTNTVGTFALAGNFATTGAFAITLAAGATVTLTLPLVNGTLATLAGVETLTNKTLGAVTLTGTVSGGGNQINNVIIGTVTPLAGFFTTLSATGLADFSAAGAGQIKFPATQNASANANTLDDYSEGTFTPALNFGGSVTGITYGTQLGHFTKVGNLVTFTINLVLTSKGAQTGAATITGMPATSTNTSGYRAAFSIYFAVGATLTTNMLMVTIPANATTLSLFDLAAGTASAMDNTDFTNTSEVTITGSYRV